MRAYRFSLSIDMMTFIEGSSSTIRDGTRPFTKGSLSIFIVNSHDRIYWREPFHNKRWNLTVYEMLLIDFIWAESWWQLIKGISSTIRDGTWPFTKGSFSILFDNRHDGIYWRELFHDKRWNSTFYERFLIDFFVNSHDRIYWRGALPR
jgi:hypothetical protein